MVGIFSMRIDAGLFLAAMMVSAPALAALPVGAVAPDFTVPAAVGGKTFTFSLADALKKGPVVVYFYPKAFTKGCTEEAHEFASAAPDYKALHATLIGLSTDDIDTLKQFSTQECSSAFPVGSDKGAVVSKEYDAVLIKYTGLSDRTSYVIAPDGKIIYAYNAMDPTQHVAKTMAAVKAFEEKR